VNQLKRSLLSVPQVSIAPKKLTAAPHPLTVKKDFIAQQQLQFKFHAHLATLASTQA
jgi:hypothetical protein